jgi:hypothetical protein
MQFIMKKNVLILCFAVTAMIGANAQNYNWSIGTDVDNFPVIGGYTEVTTIQGLTIVPKNPMEGTIPTNMGATNASKKTVDGIEYANRMQFNGGGYSGAAATDAEPTTNMPSQRYLTFDVTGAVSVSIVGTSGSSGSDRKIFLTDGTNLIGSFDYVGDGSVVKQTVNYTGGAATLYAFCNASCNIYHIIVSGGGTAITQTDANKEIKSVEYYDIMGRKATNENLKNTLLIKKTTYTDGTTLSSKVITKAY